MSEASAPSVPKDFLTVVETVYHRPFGQEPKSAEFRFSRELETNEQVYERRLKVGEEWQPLDCGWLGDNVGMLSIHNHEGESLQVNPTDEEQESISKRIVELAYDYVDMSEYDYGSWLVPPGESFRGYPRSPKELRIRCQSGTAWITLYLYPR